MAIEKIKIDTAKAKKKKKKENEKDEWKRQYVTELHLEQKTRKLLLYDLYIHKLCKVAIRQQ